MVNEYIHLFIYCHNKLPGTKLAIISYYASPVIPRKRKVIILTFRCNQRRIQDVAPTLYFLCFNIFPKKSLLNLRKFGLGGLTPSWIHQLNLPSLFVLLYKSMVQVNKSDLLMCSEKNVKK